MSERSTWTWKHWLGLTVLLLVISVGAKEFGKETADHRNVRNLSLHDDGVDDADVSAAVTRQPSDGYTAEQIDAEAAARIGEYFAKRVYEEASRYLEERGEAGLEQPTSETVFLEVDGKRLGVTRLHSDGNVGVVLVFGIVGDEFVRVQCMSRSMSRIPLSRGPCREKLQEAFGVSIGS
jgi:hypothetical protein